MIKLSKMHKRLLALSAVMPMGAAMAQTATQPQLETVVVTAQRRAENIKDVPVSVTMLKDERLDTLLSGGQDIRVLASKVPSLNIESSNGRTFPRFYIRGYGNTDFNAFASQPVSLIYDDVVQENGILKGFPMFDLAGVEVLRGPQGTLFGRNTPAGVVKFESAKPTLDKVEGYYSLSIATHNTINVEGAANVPLSKEWAMRVSTLRQHRDDFVDNTFTGAKDSLEGYNEHAERVQFLYQPSTTFNALFNVHSRSTTGSARLFRANLIKKGTNDFADGYDFTKIGTDTPNGQHLRTNGSNLRLTWDLGAVKLFSITGYEGVDDYLSRGDIDGGHVGDPAIPFPVATAGGLSYLKQYSQEFRVESKNAGPLNWQTGVYWFKESAEGINDTFNTGGDRTSHLISHQNNTAKAIFGSVTYDLSSDLVLRGGVRYTNDKKDFRTVTNVNVVQAGPSTADADKSKANWDASLTYKLNPDVNVYTRVATGFRAPSIAPASAAVPITVADAETITSYEAGIKADLFNRRARANFSVYNYEVKNQQLTVVGGLSNANQLINAAKTKGRGVEADFEAFITPAFKVTAGGSYNFTEIKDPSLRVATCNVTRCTVTDPVDANGFAMINGNPLPQAPKYTVNATARYNWALENGNLFVLTDWAYRSKINFFLYESKEFTGKSMVEGGLRVGYNWDGGKYEVAAFGRNITNTERITGGIDFNNLTGFVNEPRQFGMQFRGNF
jgi:iron complex outermembrane receptor protein